MDTKRILFVFAHPDDEAFTSGVAIAKYAKGEHVIISLLCATRGQAGKAGEPPICSRAELPEYRERELRKAAGILGIQNVDILDYEDKHLADVPMNELVNHIQSTIAQYQPQIVITFAPHGISGHPDHQVISQACTEAINQLELQHTSVKKFYYVTHSSAATFGVTTPRHTDQEEIITTQITAPEYVSSVAEALLAHRTQHLSVDRVFPGLSSGDYRYVRTVNHFILAWSNLQNYKLTDKETDLFAGL